MVPSRNAVADLFLDLGLPLELLQDLKAIQTLDWIRAGFEIYFVENNISIPDNGLDLEQIVMAQIWEVNHP